MRTVPEPGAGWGLGDAWRPPCLPAAAARANGSGGGEACHMFVGLAVHRAPDLVLLRFCFGLVGLCAGCVHPPAPLKVPLTHSERHPPAGVMSPKAVCTRQHPCSAPLTHSPAGVMSSKAVVMVLSNSLKSRPSLPCLFCMNSVAKRSLMRMSTGKKLCRACGGKGKRADYITGWHGGERSMTRKVGAIMRSWARS